MTILIDPTGRHIHKLRLSLLDACSFRCIYCMPLNPQFMPMDKLIKREEIKRIATSLVDLGIDELRLTGGEPTIRPDFMSIMEDLSKLNIKKLSFTSNGLFSKELFPNLKKTKCNNINFSLDSLNAKIFQQMTGSSKFKMVLENILMAIEFGFKVKINCVLMKGLNDHEILDFVRFSGENLCEVRFLELMRIGPARNKFDQYFISADEMIAKLEEFSNLEIVARAKDSTSFNYSLNNGGQIGIIASESKPFCGSCSRLRLSATGELRPCLMIDKGISLVNKSQQEIETILHQTMALKPVDRIFEVNQPMNQIGG
jgi:GTP 3',8-cyclase